MRWPISAASSSAGGSPNGSLRRTALAGGKAPFQPAVIDDAIVWAALCGILGGRLAFVFVYNLDYYLANPGSIIAVWEGGMAFHGGIVGAVVDC